MRESCASTFMRYFRRGEKGGQIATFITLVIAVMFLFAAVTLNIGALAQKKTITANAADGSVMKLASYLGSYSHKLSLEYFGGGTEYCKSNWGGLFQILAIIILVVIAVVLTVMTGVGGALAGSTFWGGVATAAAVGAAIATVSYGVTNFALDDGVAAALQRELNKLSFEDNITEQSVMYALGRSIDDPTMITDVHDYDEDGDTTDEISAFSAWYAERVLSMTAGITNTKAAKVDAFIPVIDAFAREAEDFYKDFSEDATRCVIYDDPSLPPDMCIRSESDGEFVDLMGALEDLGPEFDLSFWVPGADSEESADGVDELTHDLNNFYIWALGPNGGLLNESSTAIVQMLDMWLPQLYSEVPPVEGAEETWYDEASVLIEDIDGWIPELDSFLLKLSTAIYAAEEEVVALTSDLADANIAITAKNDEIDLKQDEINTVNEELALERAVVPPDAVRITELETQLAALQAELLALQGEFTVLEADRDLIQVDLDAAIAYRDHLLSLRPRLVAAINELARFQDVMGDFNADIINFYLGLEESAYTYKRDATYSWHDSAGWHHVRTSVSSFTLPWIRTQKHKRWYGFKMCTYLENYTGEVFVNVKRYDQSTARSFFARGTIPIWKHRYVKDINAEDTGAFDPSDPDEALDYGIYTEAVARYYHNALPNIVSVK